VAYATRIHVTMAGEASRTVEIYPDFHTYLEYLSIREN